MSASCTGGPWSGDGRSTVEAWRTSGLVYPPKAAEAPEAVRDAVVLVDRSGVPQDLSVEFDGPDGQHCFLFVPLRPIPHDRGTRLLTRLQVHGVTVRIVRK